MSDAAQIQLIISAFALLGIIANNVSSYLTARAQKRTEKVLQAQDAKLATVATATKLEEVHVNTNSRLDQAKADADAANQRLYAVMEELRRVNATGTRTPVTRTGAAPPVTMDGSGAVSIEGDVIPPPPREP